uniref:Uncharacterized protein n=1 Tax=Kitasatospora sp. NRRL F-6133 TaxID=1415539 RepID=U5YNI8_9ACTN|nr:hypothetical protein [Kitasatospora sp. NRRL F-6133]
MGASRSHDAAQSGPVEALRRTLAWAAGAPWPHGSESGAVEPEALVAALHAHRLDARFLRRLGEPGAPAVPDAAVRRVRERLDATRERVRRQRELFAELAAACPEERLVMLKGSTLYAHTGDPDSVRYSGDLDIVAAAPERAVRTAAAALDLERTADAAVLDEYAGLLHPELGLIEVHSYFPVPVLPPSVRTGAASPGRNPGAWRHEACIGEHRLTHADLLENLADGIPGVLAPELAVIVYAAHLYGDYLRTMLPLPAGTVRLDEVATVVDLCALPAFRPERFVRLVDRHRAHDVIGFVRALAADVLGLDPFDGVLPPAPDPLFPVDLWWDGVEGFLVDLGWHPWELVVRDRHPDATLGALDPAAVPVAPGAPAVVTAATAAPDTGGRFAHRTEHGTEFAVTATFTDTGTALRVRVDVPTVPDDRFTGVALYFGDNRYEVFHAPAEDGLRLDDYSTSRTAAGTATVGVERTAQRDELTLELPWAALAASRTPDGRRLPLLFAVRQQYLGWGRTAAGLVLPLRLEHS